MNDFKFILFPKPFHGDFGQFFPTGTYTGIGTTFVESETCYEKHHEKKISQSAKQAFGSGGIKALLLRLKNDYCGACFGMLRQPLRPTTAAAAIEK